MPPFIEEYLKKIKSFRVENYQKLYNDSYIKLKQRLENN